MGSVVKLEGNWDFCFDPVDAGVIDQWFKKKPSQTAEISLPHVWSQEKNEEEAHIGYYFKSFTVDKKESQKRFFLRFHSVLHHATVWLNGEELGSHLGGYAPFDLDGSKAVRIGEPNLLVLRVQSLDRQGKILDQTASELPLGGPFHRSPYAGLLGGVTLFMAGKAGIRALNILPDYEADRITIDLKFWNPKNFQADLEITITHPDGFSGSMQKSVKLEKENGAHSLTLQLENVKLWHIHDPNLYRMHVELAGSYGVDAVFAIRGIDVDKGTFKLNHQSLKVRGVGYPWVFPYLQGVPGAPLDFRKELQSIKDAGFNLLRSGGAPLPGFILDLCDEIGLLVLQETSAYNQKSSKEGLELLKHQIQTLIEVEGFHPCLAGWVIGSENGSMVLENGNKLLRFAAELDPTRPIFSNLASVSLDSAGSGKIDLGKVFVPSAATISPFESHRFRLAFPVSVRTFSMLAAYCSSKDGKSVSDGMHGSRSFWERYNYLKDDLDGKVQVDGLGLPFPEGLDELLQSAKAFPASPEYRFLAAFRHELAALLPTKALGVFKDPEAFFREATALARQGLSKQVEGLLINPQIGGFTLDTWGDYGHHLGGLLNWNRKPKASLEVLRRLNRNVQIIAEAEDRTPYSGTSAAIKIHMVNDGGLGDYGLLLRVKGPNGRIWHQESLPGKAKPGINLIGRFKFPVGFERGRFTFDLNLSKNNKEIMRTEEVFLVPPEAKLDPWLKKVRLLGSFPDTVAAFQNEKAETTVLIDLAAQEDAALKALFQQVQQGATLILGPLQEEDVRKITALKLLPFPLSALRSFSSAVATYHILGGGPVFKDLPNSCLLDQTYADVYPLWSLELPETAKVEAAGLFWMNQAQDGHYFKTGSDLASLPFGKGRLVFCQFDIFGKLGKNALADALFGNLIGVYSKG